MDLTLQKKIDEKIKEIAPALEMLPGVAIVHDIRTQLPLYMCKRGLEILQVDMKKLNEIGGDYYKVFFNHEDEKDYVPKIIGLLERNNNDEMVSYFQQVRHGEHGDWHLWLTSTKIFLWDDNRIPLLLLTVTVPVDPNHNISAKVERIMEENRFLRSNKDAYSALSKREAEILRLMALDKSGSEIGEQLSLSEETVKTHRRNIKKKINAKNQYDVVKFAQAFEIV